MLPFITSEFLNATTPVWMAAMRAALVQGFLALAFVGGFWALFRRHMSHAFSHGLFFIVSVKTAAAFLFAAWPVAIAFQLPLPATLFQLIHPIQKLQPPEKIAITARLQSLESLTEQPQMQPAAALDTAQSPQPPFEFVTDQPTAAASPHKARPAATRPPISALAWLMLAWAMGVLVFTLAFLVKHLRMMRRLHHSQVRPDATHQAFVNLLARQMKMRRAPLLLETPAVATPAVLGLLRQKLLVPEGFFTAFNNDETRWALLHELAHLRRRDLYWLAFERAVGLALFFHPALWAARRATRFLRELACDDMAQMQSGLSPRTCAETFLKLVIWSGRPGTIAPKITPTLSLTNRYPTIQKRIMNMTERQDQHRPARLSGGTAFAIAVFTALVSLPFSLRIVAQAPTGDLNQEVAINAQEPLEAGPTAKSNETSSFLLQLIDEKTNAPIAGANISARIDYALGINDKTDNKGELKIPFDPAKNDSLILNVNKEGYVSTLKHWNRIEEPEPIQASVMLIKLQPGIKIGGRVIDESGKPVADAKVQVQFSSNNMRTGDRSMRPALVKTNLEGYWTSSEVYQESTLLDINVAHRQFYFPEDKGHINTDAIVYPPFTKLKDGSYTTQLKRGLVCSGRVIDAEGKPVEGAEVLSSLWSYESFEEVQKTGKDGKFKIENIMPGPPDFNIAVHKPGFAWLIKTIGPGYFDRETTFDLQKGKKIMGLVTDISGQPLKNVMINNYLLYLRSINRPIEPTFTDIQGRFEFSDLPADYINIVASRVGYIGHEKVVDTAIQNQVKFVMEKQFYLEGLVHDRVTGKPIESFEIHEVSNDVERQPSLRSRTPERGYHGKFRAAKWTDKPAAFHYEIIAAGYKTYKTDVYRFDAKPESIKIELEPENEMNQTYIKGKVFQPDGKPAVGAAIGYFTDELYFSGGYYPVFKNGLVVGMEHNNNGLIRSPVKLVTTGPDGSFQLPVYNFKMGWFVTHASGVFRSSTIQPIPIENNEIRLQPYGRIEGRLQNLGKPVVDAKVWFSYHPFTSHVNQEQTASLDDQGRFIIERVVPGKVWLGYPNQSHVNMKQRHGRDLMVSPGATLRVDALMDKYTFEERRLGDDGQILNKDEIDRDARRFRVVGKVTDLETGQPVTSIGAALLSGLKGDERSINNQRIVNSQGAFYAVNPIPGRNSNEDFKGDPYLVVFSEGYETYVSSNRLKRVEGFIEHDVKLKRLAQPPRLYSGRIVQTDGLPAQARISYNLDDSGLQVGDAVYMWDSSAGMSMGTDGAGYFQFSESRNVNYICAQNRDGCALITAKDFAKLPNGILKIAPWATIQINVSGINKRRIWLNYKSLQIHSNWAQPQGRVELPESGKLTIERALPIETELEIYDYTDRAKPVLLKSEKLLPIQGKNYIISFNLAEAAVATKPDQAQYTIMVEVPAKVADPTNAALSFHYRGKVLLPDGRPAVHRRVGFSTSRDDFPLMEGGIITGSQRGSKIPITDAQGQFELRTESQVAEWLVPGQKASVRQPGHSIKDKNAIVLQLQHSGGIQGRLLINGKPNSDTTVSVLYFKKPLGKLFPGHITTVDGDGKYQFQGLIPGQAILEFRIGQPGTARPITRWQTVEIRPGELKSADLNLKMVETQRTDIYGRIRFLVPDSTSPHKDVTKTTFDLRPLPGNPLRIEKGEGSNEMEIRAKYLETPEGIVLNNVLEEFAYVPRHLHSNFDFRLTDVPYGKYELLIHTFTHEGALIGSVSKTIDINERTAGTNHNPIDLGELIIDQKKNNAVAIPPVKPSLKVKSN